MSKGELIDRLRNRCVFCARSPACAAMPRPPLVTKVGKIPKSPNGHTEFESRTGEPDTKS